MNILKIDLKNKEFIFIPQTIEDLWVIKSIIKEGDILKGNSYRRFKNEQTGESERKPVFVEILIEKQEYSSTLNSLRFTGKIVSSNPVDFAPIGEYHTIEVSLQNKYSVSKQEIFEFEIDLLKNSTISKDKINIVILDDEVAELYLFNGFESNNVATIRSGKHGKRYNQSFDFSNFFQEIASIILKDKNQLIIGGPGGTKDLFSKYLKEKFNFSSFLIVNISSTSKSSINELLSKKEVLKYFENSIIYKEKEMLDKFKENLGKDNSLYAYGLLDIEKIILTGACDFLLISFNLWKKETDRIQNLIKNAEKVKTTVFVVDISHEEIIKTLDSFGGIISVLRYKVF